MNCLWILLLLCCCGNYGCGWNNGGGYSRTNMGGGRGRNLYGNNSGCSCAGGSSRNTGRSTDGCGCGSEQSGCGYNDLANAAENGCGCDGQNRCESGCGDRSISGNTRFPEVSRSDSCGCGNN